MRPFLNWLAAVASFLGLFFTLRPPASTLGPWQILFLLLSVIAFGWAAIRDIREDLNKSKKKYRNNSEINKYMYDMLNESGACEICSRDASWVSDRRIFSVLEQKSKKGELTFLVHKRTEEIKQLEKWGAEVIEYGVLGFDPITRFTIVNPGNKPSSYVAVGRKKPNEDHIIEELDTSHPTYSMAADLINAVKIAHDYHKKNQES